MCAFGNNMSAAGVGSSRLLFGLGLVGIAVLLYELQEMGYALWTLDVEKVSRS